jgi:hypothetical protein
LLLGGASATTPGFERIFRDREVFARYCLLSESDVSGALGETARADSVLLSPAVYDKPTFVVCVCRGASGRYFRVIYQDDARPEVARDLLNARRERLAADSEVAFRLSMDIEGEAHTYTSFIGYPRHRVVALNFIRRAYSISYEYETGETEIEVARTRLLHLPRRGPRGGEFPSARGIAHLGEMPAPPPPPPPPR